MNNKRDIEDKLEFHGLNNMMQEYDSLSIEAKQRYLNSLTEWYMHEKDALNMAAEYSRYAGHI